MSDKPKSLPEYFEIARSHPAYWEEAIELAVSEGTIKSLAKQIAEIYSNKRQDVKPPTVKLICKYCEEKWTDTHICGLQEL